MGEDDDYQEFVDRVPYRAMTVQKAWKESEDQQPYKTDDDYQELENTYFDPSINFRIPSIKTVKKNNIPNVKLTCEELWKKMFFGLESTTDNMFWQKWAEYVKVCPSGVVEDYCCGKGLVVTGPDNNEVDSGSTTTFGFSGGGKDCLYEWSATRGRAVAGVYYAPDVYGSDAVYADITVSPFTGKDKNNPCLTFKVKIKGTGACAGGEGISYTSPQMQTGATQTLTATGTDPLKSYSWYVSAGGGSVSPSTGTSTTYTAPATNANCTNNPTIQLKCGSNVCATVSLAVNASSDTSWATEIWYDMACWQAGFWNCSAWHNVYYCSGTAVGSPYPCGAGAQSAIGCSDCYATPTLPACSSGGKTINQLIALSPIDNRSDALKLAGCCPWTVL
jgi:hypothetical protein